MKGLGRIAIILWLAHALVCSADEGILSFSASDGGYATGTAGWTFTPLTDISVTSLGCFNLVASNYSSLGIGLWDANGTLLASNSITPSSSLLNQTRYEPIGPVTLTLGSTYYLGASAGGNPIILLGAAPANGGSVNTSPEIQLGSAAFAPGDLVFPSQLQGGQGAAFLVPNIEFTVVPEPSSFTLLLVGGLTVALRRRWRQIF